MGSKIISYTDFRKGLNDTVSRGNMQDNELKQAVNIDLSVRGGFSSRKGTSKINPDSFGHDCTQLIQWNFKDEERLLAVINNRLYRVNENGTRTLKQVLGARSVGTFAIKNALYFGDGRDIWKMDNDVVTPLIATDGNLFAKHRLVIDSHAQVAGNVTVTAGGTARTVALALNDSRTSVATKIAAASYPDFTITRQGHEVTFTSTVPGDRKLFYDPHLTGAWGNVFIEERGITADNIFSDFRKCKMFVLHVNSMRIFASGNVDDPTAVYYSEPGDPTFVKSTSIMYPASAEGKVTGMIQFMQSILVSYTYSWWQFSGDDPEGEFGAPNATWVRLPIPHGAVSPDTVVLTPQSFTFLSRSGLHAVSINLLSQTFVVVDSSQLVKNLTGEKVDVIMGTLKKPELARLIYYQNKLYLAYCQDETLTHNNRVLVYDWRTEGFVQYTGWRVNDWSGHKGNLIFGSTNFIFKHDLMKESDIDFETGSDRAIRVVFETKAYNLDSDVNSKFLNLLHVISGQRDDKEVDAVLKIVSDYHTTTKLFDGAVDLVYGREWGKIWGWNDTIRQKYEVKRIGFNFSVIIEISNIDQPITILGFGFQYKALKSQAERDIVDDLLV